VVVIFDVSPAPVQGQIQPVSGGETG